MKAKSPQIRSRKKVIRRSRKVSPKKLPAYSLKDKVAIVTGAGTGIGEATAHKFASLGAKVVCAGLPGDPLGDVVAAIRRRGHEAIAFEGDLSNLEISAACVQFTIKNFGKLHILVNNAGIAISNTEHTEEVTEEIFMRTVRNNIFSVFYMTRAALPELKKTQGVLLATGSVAGLKGEPGDTVYGGTKGFVHSFMQGIAIEHAPHGIRVNCVCPGAIDTGLARRGHSAMTKVDEKEMIEGIPMRRLGTPEEIANVFAFLASDLATYVSGALWPVDGAYTLGLGATEDVPSSVKRRPRGVLDAVLRHSIDGGYKKNNPEPREKLA
ncbi:MAG: SDR family oxidoreductase [Pseudomonadota bacterium]|nr:SDR family oxidoreductase [Pseudomonadota bacterium]